MSMLTSDIDDFENVVTKFFHFLESDYGFTYAGIGSVQEDPRDSYVSAKYRLGGMRVDIVWNPMAMSLGAFIKLNNNDLSNQQKYVYFEPFIEFITEGSVKPVVPQIYPSMSVGKIERAMEQRAKCFEKGISHMVENLAARFKECYQMLEAAPMEAIKQYQKWYLNRGKSA